MRWLLGALHLTGAWAQNEVPTTLSAPELYGSVACAEPQIRFDSTISDKISHNHDFPNNPEEWLCGFCDADLFSVVQRVCCGEVGRKRREAEEMNAGRPNLGGSEI